MCGQWTDPCSFHPESHVGPPCCSFLSRFFKLQSNPEDHTDTVLCVCVWHRNHAFICLRLCALCRSECKTLLLGLLARARSESRRCFRSVCASCERKGRPSSVVRVLGRVEEAVAGRLARAPAFPAAGPSQRGGLHGAAGHGLGRHSPPGLARGAGGCFFYFPAQSDCHFSSLSFP